MSTNGVKFLTHEVGSLAKPPWLVKTSAGKPLQDSDIEHARKWGEKVGVEDYQQLIELLEADERDPDEVARWSSRYCMRLQESAGVDWIWDGEQQRSEMYAWAIAHSNGFEPRGTIRSDGMCARSRHAWGVSASSSKTVTQRRSGSIPYTSVTSSNAHRTASSL